MFSFPFVLLTLYLILERFKESNNTTLVILIVFFFMVLVGVVNNATHLLYPPKPDAGLYDRFGWAIAQSLRSGEPIPWRINHAFKRQSYAFFTGLMYYLAGHTFLIMQIINSFLTSLALFNIARLSRIVFDRTTGVYSLLIACLYPSLYTISAAHIREAIIIFSLTQLVYLVFQWFEEREFRTFAYSLLAAVGTFITRTENLLLVAVLYGEVVLVDLIHLGRERKKLLAGIILSLVLFAVLLWTLPQTHQVIVKHTDSFNLEGINSRRRGPDRIDADYPGVTRPVQFRSWKEVVRYLPRTIFSFFLKRYPWKSVNLPYTRAWLTSVYILGILALSVAGFYKGLKNHPIKTMTLLFYLIVFAAVYGLYSNWPGMIRRHRIPAIMLILPFSGYLPRILIQKYGLSAVRYTEKIEPTQR